VVIAAACNQWVTKRVADSIPNETSRALRDMKTSLLTYNWRLAPESGDHQHIWLGQTLLILTTLVLSCVVVAVVVQGRATFGRAFLTCWTVVAFATMLGAYVRGFVNDAAGTAGSRLTRAVFGPLGPNAVTFFAGFVLGLVVGLIAGAVAVGTRSRPAVAEPVPVTVAEHSYRVPEQPPPYYGTTDTPAWQDQHFAPHARPADPSDDTTQLPTVDGHTTRIPDPGEPTTRFPRPPDDEEMN
jgi:hypothetical protein